MANKISFFLMLFTIVTLNAQHLNSSKKTSSLNIKNSIGIEPEMVFIQGDIFSMGSIDGDSIEKPIHGVTISNFKMGKYEVTVEQFAAFIEATHYLTDAEKMGFDDGQEYPVIYGDLRDDSEFKERNWRYNEIGVTLKKSEWNRPVIFVSWNDANVYCHWLSKQTGKKYRLPTEAEWEFAAGNGATHTKYSWGNDLPNNNHKVGNLADETSHPIYDHNAWNGYISDYTDGYYFSAPVGSFEANKMGLYDMTGNVEEWCSDIFNGDNYYSNSPNTDPQGYEIHYVNRGGSWNDSLGSKEIHAQVSPASVTRRRGDVSNWNNYDCGFRVAISIFIR